MGHARHSKNVRMVAFTEQMKNWLAARPRCTFDAKKYNPYQESNPQPQSMRMVVGSIPGRGCTFWHNTSASQASRERNFAESTKNYAGS